MRCRWRKAIGVQDGFALDGKADKAFDAIGA
jgi:hypothetical protein